MMQFLKVGIAENETIVGIPQDEGFWNCLNCVAQPHVGGDSLLDQAFLLCDIDSDPDQVQARLPRLAHKLASRTQPHPMAGSVAHTESVIDRCCSCIGQLGGEFIKPDIVRMHEGIYVTKRQQIIFGLESQYFEHGLRPEDAAAGEIPIPQTASPPVERGLDAAADRAATTTCLTRPSG